ncbi:peptidoglycan-binding protein [Calidifontibacter sp. DB0510]|uniref:Peptidoglycan-binding protein n=1 Tax=Metallococcus carri TaxID=1656884 RepID=A0A967B0D8_9MICO|nr:peptidoglycan-binding protein [Metallococcus carri]NHN55755.1 peptidoglycan-binding protein [Metallococcus carri]NHN55762.1 peptidoglycan-binding protein [Metallococcus carri]NOP38549.1 peptidoglycan-binding protein [Calidifontibacter sp. DB2511S]NOP38556.1 peptidoglycan-binding protein [Calidifontibacter sp. DB2511S]
MSALTILSRNGIRANADALITAANKVGVPLWIAAAFCEQESGGANVYGNDRGGAMAGAGAVTETNYRQFLQLVNSGHTSNGVGPFQITYKGYFAQAAQQGLRLWLPLDNMIFGLRIVKSYLGGHTDDATLNRAGQRYNSGRPDGAPLYGASIVKRATRWRGLLAGVSTTPATPPTTTAPAGFKAGATLRRGSTGYRVKALQQGLRGRFNSQVAVDGDYGAYTEGAIKAVQKLGRLQIDGVCGPATQQYLYSRGVVIPQ